MSSMERIAVFGVALAAMIYFSVSVCSLLYNSLPYMLWYWAPDELGHIEIPDDPKDLLPAERKHDETPEGPSTLARFRMETGFPVLQAVLQYEREPLDYVAGLEEISKEICGAAQQSDPAGYYAFLDQNRVKSQRHWDTGDSKVGKWTYMTLRQYTKPGQTVRLNSFREWITLVVQWIGSDSVTSVAQHLARIAGGELVMGPLRRPETESTVWMGEYKKFGVNLKSLCQRIGNPFHDLDPPETNIFRLKQYTSEGKKRVDPLYMEIKNLRGELDNYKRINAALQIRQAIEKLVGVIPHDFRGNRYKKKAPGVRWGLLWEDICTDVYEHKNDKNPFHKLLTETKGLALEDIKRKAGNLYSDMSAEIHNYEPWALEAINEAFQYRHFDRATRDVTSALCPYLDEEKKPEMDVGWADVDWNEIARQYLPDL